MDDRLNAVKDYLTGLQQSICDGLELYEYRTVLLHHFVDSVDVVPQLQVQTNLAHEDGTFAEVFFVSHFPTRARVLLHR